MRIRDRILAYCTDNNIPLPSKKDVTRIAQEVAKLVEPIGKAKVFKRGNLPFGVNDYPESAIATIDSVIAKYCK